MTTKKNRRSGDARHVKTAIKAVLDSSTREEAMRMGRLIGAIQDSVTEHVLNDQTVSQFMSPKMKNINEKYFRVIGMHQWTNMTRVMGLVVGREFLRDHAARAQGTGRKAEVSRQHLEELGVTHDQVTAWFDAGMPTANDVHSDVISALNTFIDESIIRPDPTIRPMWGSDRNLQIFFHLKSFMWGYHEMILRRIWNRRRVATCCSISRLKWFSAVALPSLWSC